MSAFLGRRGCRQFGSSKQSSKPLNKYSSVLTGENAHGGGKAMLYATGIPPEKMHYPQIGIASCWWEGNPCNMHLNELQTRVHDGMVCDDRMIPRSFNTIGVSDGMSMGNEGMRYSLPSRDLIADSIELQVAATHYDGVITIAGCDKNMPGCVMALARLNRPGFMIYGGTIKPGTIDKNCVCDYYQKQHANNVKGDTIEIDIVSGFQAFGECKAGKISESEKQYILERAVPGAGACGGMYTANTMSTCIEALGLSPLYSSSLLAEDARKSDECETTAVPMMHTLLERDIKPRDIITRKSLQNAASIMMALGGSTNGVLHLIAIAHAAQVEFTLDDIQRISDAVPYIGNLRPSGKYYMSYLQGIGGTPAVIAYLISKGLFHGDCMTVTGKTMHENVAHIPSEYIFDAAHEYNDVVYPVEAPLMDTGHIKVLYGNIASEGCVAKLTGKQGLKFCGHAIVCESEQDFMRKFNAGEISKDTLGDKRYVIVIRNEGPKGGPGLPEMLVPTTALVGAGLVDQCALITDGRFSGGSHGFIVGHVTPESYEGGNIALIQDGDLIEINANDKTLDVLVPTQILDERRVEYEKGYVSGQNMKKTKYTCGVLAKYTKLVQSASKGCITDA